MDLNMLGKNGINAVRLIFARNLTPILMLSCSAAVTLKSHVLGLVLTGMGSDGFHSALDKGRLVDIYHAKLKEVVKLTVCHRLS